MRALIFGHALEWALQEGTRVTVNRRGTPGPQWLREAPWPAYVIDFDGYSGTVERVDTDETAYVQFDVANTDGIDASWMPVANLRPERP